MDEILGPLAVLYCWQSMLLAFGVAAITNVLKNALDLRLGGREARTRKLFAHRVIMPLMPIVLGAGGAALIPIHPEALTDYLTAHNVVGVRFYLSLAAYGGAVGQFSDYVWHRYSGIRDDVKKKKEVTDASTAADPRPVVEPKPPEGA
jgi:hypothetical protein